MVHGRGSWVLAVAALAVAGLTGCSGSTSSPSTSTGGTHTVAPGHDTPQDAADGLIQAELAGNQQQACDYFVPSQQANCRGQQPSLPKGHASVVGAVTSGDLALVEVTGRVCVSTNACENSTDPTVGLPKGSVTFQQAYSKALSSVTFSPVPCKKVNGQWYVNTGTS
jgi:hypothetical protein